MQSRMHTLYVAAAGTIAILFWAATALAQQTQYRAPSVNAYRNILNRPTVSPYLNLVQRSANGLPTYQTLVRPLVEQRQAEVRNAAAIQQLQSDVNRRASPTRSTGESQQVRGTGHISGFMNHMHFYDFGR